MYDFKAIFFQGHNIFVVYPVEIFLSIFSMALSFKKGNEIQKEPYFIAKNL